MTKFNDLDYIGKIEELYTIPKNILLSLLRVESGLDQDALGIQTRHGRAVGIAQILPKFHPTVDPRDPYRSIDYAGKSLKAAYDEFGDWKLAVASWHSGSGAVRRAKGIPSTSDGLSTTRDYVDKIFAMAGVSTGSSDSVGTTIKQTPPMKPSQVGFIVGVILLITLLGILGLSKR